MKTENQTYTAKELRNTRFLVSRNGGEVYFVDPETGEVVTSVGVPSGIQYVDSYLTHLPKGLVLSHCENVVVSKPGGSRITRQRASDIVETAANPDYRPGTMSEAEREMRQMMQRMSRQEERINQKVAEMQAVAEVVKKNKETPENEQEQETPPNEVIDQDGETETPPASDGEAEKGV